jgi:hypothetical protein
MIPAPGVSEQSWLADLKETAKQIGSSALGQHIPPDVENLTPGSGRRPDNMIRRDTDGAPPTAAGQFSG